MSHVGFIHAIHWSNPYTEPPRGLPRTLAEVFIPLSGEVHGTKTPDFLYEILPPRGTGWSTTIRALNEPIKEISKEKKVSIRRKRLARRINNKYPMFAEQFVQETISRKSDYYNGNDEDAGRNEILQKEQDDFIRFTSNPGKLFIYGRYEP